MTVISIDEEMERSYIDYAMSVIVGRAIPDARDGLKPVHRRILYSMWEEGNTSRSTFSKSGGTVGDVLKKYHPHGDGAIYDAMVRMAQDFSLRYPLITGQGNFGSIDGYPAAAYRYTEARMAPIAETLLEDIKKDTVPFIPSYDNKRQEPFVLPSMIPSLLINGSSGIAVGMATNIPPHNLGEVVDALIFKIENPDSTVDDLLSCLPGPAFPTGGIIYGTQGVRRAYRTGYGRLRLRAKADFETKGNRDRIIISEIPYQVNKSELVKAIDGAIKEQRIDTVTNIRDESGREEGLRIVLDVRQGVNPDVALNQLYKHSNLETTFGWNNLALVNNQPIQLTLLDTLRVFVDHRVEIVTKRFEYDLEQTKARLHILEGLQIALDNIEEVIRVIRTSKTNDEIWTYFREKLALSDKQIRAILDMRLRQLARLESEKIDNEHAELTLKAEYCEKVLSDRQELLKVIKEELEKIKDDFGDNRRTVIITEADDDYSESQLPEELIPEEDIIIIRTSNGYIKSIPADAYKTQHRGGKGVFAMGMRDEDLLEDLLSASTHDTILIFTDAGKVYGFKGYEIPTVRQARTARGIAIPQIVRKMSPDENVSEMVAIRDFDTEGYLIFATRNGMVKRT